MKAAVGFRSGPNGVFAVDFDINVAGDSASVLHIAIEIFGDQVAVRRVDHPDHHKLLICARMAGEMPRSFDWALTQSDGQRGKIQFLGDGRYFNVAGVHPGRKKPYVWDRDPAIVPLVLISRNQFDAFWARVNQSFDAVKVAHVHSANELERQPERCTPTEVRHYLSLIPNDHGFEDYDPFIAMGSAIYGASNGEPWGKAAWEDWCGQVEQGDPDKPERFWDTMHKARIGAEMLRRWAQARQPQTMAKEEFGASPIEEEIQAEADTEAALAQEFLTSHCLVGGSEFYNLPPARPYAPAAFNLENIRHGKSLRRYFGDKR